MSVAVVTNFTKSGADECTENIINKLSTLGAEPVMLVTDAEKLRINNIRVYDDIEAMFKKCDSVIAVGGDGTIIGYAKIAARYDKPILGVNLGRIGFVAGLEPYELDLLESFINGEYLSERRMLLNVKVTHNNVEDEFLAFNDAVISRGSLSRIIDLSVSLNDKPLCSYRADGLLFSTPTGSTAYSLSAGGPVIQPHMHCILLTPVCPHSLFARSVIFCEESVLSVMPKDSGENEIFLTVDGQQSIQIHSDDKITITKSQFEATIVSMHSKDFYKILSEKLNERGV